MKKADKIAHSAVLKIGGVRYKMFCIQLLMDLSLTSIFLAIGRSVVL